MLPEAVRPSAIWRANWLATLSFPWRPIFDTNCSQSLSFAALLPLPFVILATLGLASRVHRRPTWLLIIAFAVGLLPSLLGPNGVSSRRLLTATIVVPFFLAMSIDLVAIRWRQAAAAVIAAAALVWGPATYFSESSWMARDKYAFCSAECVLMPYIGPEQLPIGCHDAGRRYPAKRRQQ
jgi:hypothetical protein